MTHDSSHSEQIERWAKFVLTDKTWKKQHSAFINSQLEMAQRALKKIARMQNGEEKLRSIRGLKNK